MLKNRESIQLSLNKKSDDSNFLIEDVCCIINNSQDKIANLEKDKLNKKITRLQKRLEEDQEYYLMKRKEFTEREKELLLSRDNYLVKLEEKELELQEVSD